MNHSTEQTGGRNGDVIDDGNNNTVLLNNGKD